MHRTVDMDRTITEARFGGSGDIIVLRNQTISSLRGAVLWSMRCCEVRVRLYTTHVGSIGATAHGGTCSMALVQTDSIVTVVILDIG